MKTRSRLITYSKPDLNDLKYKSFNRSFGGVYHEFTEELGMTYGE